MVKLGFFEDFKGADTVLISLSANEAGTLAAQLQHFASSNELAMELAASIVPEHEANLLIVREIHAEQSRGGFRWLCGPWEVADIVPKLRSLATAGKGHQYFDLLGSEVQLMVSVGEYGAHGKKDV